MNDTLINEIGNDCRTLLTRALEGKSIACFGVDGFGLFGQTDRAQRYEVSAFTVQLDMTSDNDFPEGRLILELEGYDANTFGHILTDQNFKISFNELLQAQDINTEMWSWDLVTPQPDNGVILEIDVVLLLEWF